MFWYFLTYISLSDKCHIKMCTFTVLSSGSFCQIYWVTDEALIDETVVWPNFFLLNVFFALKGSKLFMSLVMRKPTFCVYIIYAKTKTQISFVVTAKLISAFVFATRIVQSLFYLNTKFQASSHLVWLYILVCV